MATRRPPVDSDITVAGPKTAFTGLSARLIARDVPQTPIDLLTSVDGPLAGVGDKVVYAYDTNGDLSQVTNEVGLITKVIALDSAGRPTTVLHTFYRLDDGSYLAFFEAPDLPFEFKSQHDFDLHVALEVEPPVLAEMLAKGKARGMETRGISDHEFVRSIYFRDPNGYVIELTAKTPQHDRLMNPTANKARDILQRWQQAKAS